MGSPGRPPWLSHSFKLWVFIIPNSMFIIPNSMFIIPNSMFIIQCCFTSTATVQTLRDGEPRTATSTFTQLLSSEQKQSHSDYVSPHCLTRKKTGLGYNHLKWSQNQVFIFFLRKEIPLLYICDASHRKLCFKVETSRSNVQPKVSQRAWSKPDKKGGTDVSISSAKSSAKWQFCSPLDE